jgi:Flp pilus assembly protein TadD
MTTKGSFRWVAVVLTAVSFVILTANLGRAAEAKPLPMAAGSAGEGHNKEGISHYEKGHWDKAEMHFRGAVKDNDNSAEAHYNLALSLDKMGNHGEATAEFGKALKLAPNNPAIADSEILKKHLG